LGGFLEKSSKFDSKVISGLKTFKAKGMIETDYTEENISISNYPLSAALTCSKLCDAFGEAWGVF